MRLSAADCVYIFGLASGASLPPHSIIPWLCWGVGRNPQIHVGLCQLRLFLLVHHRLRGSGSTVVTMTSKVNGRMEILTPVDLKPSKIW